MSLASEHSCTVLIVEDDPDSLEATAEVLASEGCTPAGVINGLEAITYLETHPVPNLILLDLMLPVMDGAEFLKAMRLRPGLASIPVVLLSGERALSQKAAELGVADYLQKPVDVESLLSTVKRHCACSLTAAS